MSRACVITLTNFVALEFGIAMNVLSGSQLVDMG